MRKAIIEKAKTRKKRMDRLQESIFCPLTEYQRSRHLKKKQIFLLFKSTTKLRRGYIKTHERPVTVKAYEDEQRHISRWLSHSSPLWRSPYPTILSPKQYQSVHIITYITLTLTLTPSWGGGGGGVLAAESLWLNKAIKYGIPDDKWNQISDLKCPRETTRNPSFFRENYPFLYFLCLISCNTKHVFRNLNREQKLIDNQKAEPTREENLPFISLTFDCLNVILHVQMHASSFLSQIKKHNWSKNLFRRRSGQSDFF